MMQFLAATTVGFAIAAACTGQSLAGEARDLGFSGDRIQGAIETFDDKVVVVFDNPYSRARRDGEFQFWDVEYSADSTAFKVACDTRGGRRKTSCVTEQDGKVHRVELITNRYLNYDSTGKSKSVVLGEQGDGSNWKRTRLSGGVIEHVVLQAVNGELKGWYLDYADEEFKVGDLVCHPLILSKEPGHIKEVIIGENDN